MFGKESDVERSDIYLHLDDENGIKMYNEHTLQGLLEVELFALSTGSK